MRKKTNNGKRFPLKTPAQQLAVRLFTKALASGKPFSVEDILMKAGYSPESARQQTNVMLSLKPHIEPIVQRLESHRDRILERMEAKVDQASYGELARALDITTKGARLLGGKSTANVALIAERRQEIDALIEHETDQGQS